MTENSLILFKKENRESDIPIPDGFVDDNHLQIHLINFAPSGNSTTWGNISDINVWVETDSNKNKPLPYTVVYDKLNSKFIFDGNGTINQSQSSSNFEVVWDVTNNTINVSKATVSLTFSGSGGSLLISPNLVTLNGEYKYGHATYSGDERFSSTNQEYWLKNKLDKTFKISLKDAESYNQYIIINDEDGLDITITNNNTNSQRSFKLIYVLKYDENNFEILTVTIQQEPLYDVKINKIEMANGYNSLYKDLSTPIIINYSTFFKNESRLCILSYPTLSFSDFSLDKGTDEVSFTFDDDSITLSSTDLGSSSDNLYGAAYLVTKEIETEKLIIVPIQNYTAKINSINPNESAVVFFNDVIYPAQMDYSSCYIAVHPCYIKNKDNRLSNWNDEAKIINKIQLFLQEHSEIDLSKDIFIFIPFLYETTLQAEYFDFNINKIQTIPTTGVTETFICDGLTVVSGDTNVYLDVNFSSEETNTVTEDDEVTQLQEEWFDPYKTISCYTEPINAEQNFEITFNGTSSTTNGKALDIKITPLMQNNAHASGFSVESLNPDTISYSVSKGSINSEICLLKCDLALDDWSYVSSNEITTLQVKKHKTEDETITVYAQSFDNSNTKKPIITIRLVHQDESNNHAYRTVSVIP